MHQLKWKGNLRFFWTFGQSCNCFMLRQTTGLQQLAQYHLLTLALQVLLRHSHGGYWTQVLPWAKLLFTSNIDCTNLQLRSIALQNACFKVLLAACILLLPFPTALSWEGASTSPGSCCTSVAPQSHSLCQFELRRNEEAIGGIPLHYIYIPPFFHWTSYHTVDSQEVWPDPDMLNCSMAPVEG